MRRTDFTASLKTARWHGTDMTLANNDATHLFAARTLPASRLGCFRLFRMLSIAYGKKICGGVMAYDKYLRNLVPRLPLGCHRREPGNEVGICEAYACTDDNERFDLLIELSFMPMKKGLKAAAYGNILSRLKKKAILSPYLDVCMLVFDGVLTALSRYMRNLNIVHRESAVLTQHDNK